MHRHGPVAWPLPGHAPSRVQSRSFIQRRLRRNKRQRAALATRSPSVRSSASNTLKHASLTSGVPVFVAVILDRSNPRKEEHDNSVHRAFEACDHTGDHRAISQIAHAYQTGRFNRNDLLATCVCTQAVVRCVGFGNLIGRVLGSTWRCLCHANTFACCHWDSIASGTNVR
jgi:hypothetical protein